MVRPSRLVDAVVVTAATASAILAVAIPLAISFTEHGIVGWDALTYLAAGERLNAGHDLYALGPGDRPVWLNPPHWTVPLLSPPFIAVLWRPLALVPIGLAIWWIVCAGAIGLVTGGLTWRLRWTGAVAILLLSPAIAWELGVANVNGLLIGGLAAVWLLARLRLDAAAGVLAAVLAALKLSPAVLLFWFVATRRWRAALAFVAAGTACLAISLVGAGIDAHIRYLDVIRDTATVGVGQLSAGRIASILGLPREFVPLVGPAIVAFGVAECLLIARRRPGLAFAVVVVVLVVGSPVVNPNSFAILLIALMPLAWPIHTPVPGAVLVRESRLAGQAGEPPLIVGPASSSTS
jgi:hypothetical protein